MVSALQNVNADLDKRTIIKLKPRYYYIHSPSPMNFHFPLLAQVADAETKHDSDEMLPRSRHGGENPDSRHDYINYSRGQSSSSSLRE